MFDSFEFNDAASLTQDNFSTCSRAQAARAATERRLYALPVLRERVADCETELAELEKAVTEALQHHPGSVVRLIRPGMGLIPKEVYEAELAEFRARLAADKREVKKMENALTSINEDPYYSALHFKYIEGMKATEIAAKLSCEPATVRRNCNRLVNRLAMRLYGVDCL